MSETEERLVSDNTAENAQEEEIEKERKRDSCMRNEGDQERASR